MVVIVLVLVTVKVWVSMYHMLWTLPTLLHYTVNVNNAHTHVQVVQHHQYYAQHVLLVIYIYQT